MKRSNPSSHEEDDKDDDAVVQVAKKARVDAPYPVQVFVEGSAADDELSMSIFTWNSMGMKKEHAERIYAALKEAAAKDASEKYNPGEDASGEMQHLLYAMYGDDDYDIVPDVRALILGIPPPEKNALTRYNLADIPKDARGVWKCQPRNRFKNVWILKNSKY